MHLKGLYYSIKPFVPRPLRVRVRQWWAQRQRSECAGIWPILESAAEPPKNWTGWPDGKRFALVLTHDVEGPSGLAKVRDLARLEEEMGFRASYNFIPEADYDTPKELRDELRKKGFEVGVHDLAHDGKLFRSAEKFRAHAKQINEYLKSWDAAGFRSGFMLRNLSWLGQLNIQYDLSTFDTDPFEPQPDGCGTIFPFWVPHTDPNRGYVELPYTLAQDSTLFIFLREKTIDIWKQKLDWVASHGGMALLNVHPDYIELEPGKTSAGKYPLEFYRQFLQYVREKYEGQYWNALPKEVASHVRPIRPQKPTQPKRICMVAYSFFESDNRVRRYAESLARRGDSSRASGRRRNQQPGLRRT